MVAIVALGAASLFVLPAPPPPVAAMTAPEPLRVVAVIAAFNEGRHIREGCSGRDRTSTR